MAAPPLPTTGGVAVGQTRALPRASARPHARTTTRTAGSRHAVHGAHALAAEPLPQAAPQPRPHARPEAPQRDLRVVPAPVRQALPTWIYGALAGTILALGVLGIVALNALAAEASFQARSLEAQISDDTLRHDDLVAAVATLASPGRVQEVATTRLGLIEPEQPGFLTLHPDDLIPQEPKPPVRLGE